MPRTKSQSRFFKIDLCYCYCFYYSVNNNKLLIKQKFEKMKCVFDQTKTKIINRHSIKTGINSTDS